MPSNSAVMLNNIQALRFYAAFAVVLYHSRKLFMELGLQGDTFLYWAKFGNFGVDVFFVISGYVMWYTTREAGRDAGTALDFLRRRLFRIYLGYWPFYILAAAVTLLIGERDPGNIYWLESFFLLNPTIRHQVLGVAWTLSYELYFYLMFTVLILLPLARARQALVVLCLVVVVLNLLQPTHTFEYGFFISPFLIEFFAGSLLAAYLVENRSRWLLLLCLAMVVVMVAWAVTLPRFHMNRIQGFGVAAIFIVLAGVVAENARIYVASRFWVFLGNCSYSIYLGHFVLLWIYLYLLRQSAAEPSLLISVVIYLSYLVVVIAFSIASYRYLEAPLYKYALNNWRFGRKVQR
ncbi:MAG: acyltransferase family protein [Haliea sp.]|nr:acyltransferase family protein [Haliea sp.]